ncbi:hypothetical protein BV25DRAFT_1864173 [Artomyces pyxidatus]|uniref:Uncharacterized protein n=1 Tax=Artomyces pyxidatus TaxID=48021 RepID=A0ACB8SK39_9AGAM|nr:hypothetical protein BV25DRAFT_1864173 [Artomyces pyxidatus]
MAPFSTLTTISLLAIAALEVSAANDWNVPCLQGQCSWDLPGAASGSLQIWGSSGAISDITPAAGWKIIDCDPNAMEQNIRLVCMSGGEAGCGHVFEGNPEGKIVRLPENCGRMPFARVAKSWVPDDQSMPSGMHSRQDTSGQIQALALDTNFSATDPGQNGNVSFAIQGTSIPGDNGDFNITAPGQRRRYHSRSMESAKISSLTSFNKTLTQSLPPVNIDKSATLLNTNINCPADQFNPASFSASANINVEAKVNAVVQLGVVAAGTVVPPKISEIGIFAGLNGDIDSTLNIQANALGSFSSGTITVFQVGIPGLDFPGILSLGPEFVVNADVTANLQLDVNAAVDLAFNINNAQLLFPPNEGSSGGTFTRSNSQLSISTSPTLDAAANVEGHLIPTLNIGVNALNGAAEATVFLALDASATIALNTTAQAPLSASTSAGASAGVTAQGCVDVSTALNVNAGATANFLNLFDQSKTVSLFNQNFDLFQKCFTGSASTGKRDYQVHGRRAMASRDIVMHSARDGATCPSASPPASGSLVNQLISA